MAPVNAGRWGWRVRVRMVGMRGRWRGRGVNVRWMGSRRWQRLMRVPRVVVLVVHGEIVQCHYLIADRMGVDCIQR